LPSFQPSTSAAPTAKRKKEKRVGVDAFFQAYLPQDDEVAEPWSTGNYDPSASGDKSLSVEFKEVFGVLDTEYGQSAAGVEPPFSAAMAKANQPATFDSDAPDIYTSGAIPDIGLPKDMGMPKVNP
jgi:hypothetical protein